MKSDAIEFESQDGTKLSGILTRPKRRPVGCTVLAHGITVEKNEDGFYTELAEELAGANVASLRFDFRGHGGSGGKPEEMTIRGELYDFGAACNELRRQVPSPMSAVATSFGAGIAVLYAEQNALKLNSIALLCPVLDYERTFIRPETEWAKEWFGGSAIQRWETEGVLDLDGFCLGSQLLAEFKVLRPYESLSRLDIPALLVHGTEDSMVPFEVTESAAASSRNVQFMPVHGADHGFEDYESQVFDEVVKWVLSHSRA